MPPLQCSKKVLPRGRPVPPTALVQVPVKPLPKALGKAVLRPRGPGVPGGRVSPHVSMGRATCLFLGAAAVEGCPALWSISHHRGYRSGGSTVRPPHPCGLSYGPWLLGRRPPPGLCTGSPVTGCFRGSEFAFAIVPDAAWLGLDQRPWGTASAAGPVGQLGRLSPVATLTQPCRFPVALLSQHPCRLPVAVLLLPCRFPAAFLPLSRCFRVDTLSSSCRHSVAFLSLPAAFRRRLPRVARI